MWAPVVMPPTMNETARRVQTLYGAGARNVALASVPPVGGSDSDKAGQSLQKLRDEVRPATLGRVDGAQAPITGQVAGSHGFNDRLVGSVVPVLAFVAVLAFLSVLLSVGAPYGILVAAIVVRGVLPPDRAVAGSPSMDLLHLDARSRCPAR